MKEQFEAEIAKKLRTAQPEPKGTGSYKKKEKQKACTTHSAVALSSAEPQAGNLWGFPGY